MNVSPGPAKKNLRTHPKIRSPFMRPNPHPFSLVKTLGTVPKKEGESENSFPWVFSGQISQENIPFSILFPLDLLRGEKGLGDKRGLRRQTQLKWIFRMSS